MAFVHRLSLLLTLTAAVSSSNVLHSEIQRLLTNESLTYGDYRLTLQRDCNLVLRRGRTATWQTRTGAGENAECFLLLQSDGKLILVNSQTQMEFRRVWSSGKSSEEGSYGLVLGHNGTLRIYGPGIWSVPDNAQAAATAAAADKVRRVSGSALWTGDVALVGRVISDGDYKLTLHRKCNLTLSNTRSGVVTWASNTKSKYVDDCFVSVQGDGALMIKHMDGSPLWSNGVTAGSCSDYALAIRPDDAKLVVYGPTIWSSVQSADVGACGGEHH